MIKIFVYAANQALAAKTIQSLKIAGAEHAELLKTLNIPARQPKEHRYIFICETPAEKLAELIPQILPESEYTQDLDNWYKAQTLIVRTATYHKKRAIVLTTGLLRNRIGLLKFINEQWGISLNVNEFVEPEVLVTEPLLDYLVEALIQKTPPLIDLSNHINALANIGNKTVDESKALIGYRALCQQNKSLGEELNDHKEERKALVNQIQCVQDELETLFHQLNLEKSIRQELNARLQRFLKTYPQLIDIDKIDASQKSIDSEAINWACKNLETNGIKREAFDFETFIESGVLGVRLPKINNLGQQNLTRWPAHASTLDAIECIPVGQGHKKTQRLTTFRQLTSSDWMLLNKIPEIIRLYIGHCAIDNTLVALTQESLPKLEKGLGLFKQAFRFDNVDLKQNLVNADYEHLWLVFKNVICGPYKFDQFEVRLSAANIVQNQFSKHPKLEFPRINGLTKPFESWFAESTDTFGEKWELRFDLNKGIFDTEVFKALKSDEQQLILALVRVLPDTLNVLESSRVEIAREWKCWQEMLAACQEVLGVCKTI